MALKIQVLIYLLALVLVSVVSAQRNFCNPVKWQDSSKKILCSCNEFFCGDIKLSLPERRNQTFIYQSTEAGKRLDWRDLREYANHDLGHLQESTITVDLNKSYQTIMGWGGAFTDSFGENVKSLPEELQHKLLESYFGASGLQYNFGRVPIGGSDFSSRKYTYDDLTKPDYDLKLWSLVKEDRELKIPIIKEAIQLSKERNVDLKLFASPWSPPAWMKQNNKLVRGHLINDDKTYRAYAEYLMKFYRRYKKEGINFWGATIQNEPVASNLPFYFFNSMQMDSAETIKFVRDYLGPALEKEGYTKENFKLMVGDDSLGFIDRHVRDVLSDPGVHKYISGFAYHWYTSGSFIRYEKLTELHESIKDKIEFMMMSEACGGSMPMQKKVDIGSWARAESYAADIIEDLNRNTNAWIDWNMALDMDGGPNWSKNNVDSAILVEAKTKTFYKQPTYYSLAHFTRFLKPGSVRVDTRHENSLFASKLMTLAVYDKTHHHVIVNVLNTSKSRRRIHIDIKGSDAPAIEFVADKKSIVTVVVKI